MPTFSYEAMREPGETIRGEVDAETHLAASTVLLHRGYHVLRVEEIRDAGGFRLRWFRRKDVTRFTRDLSVLLKSGLPLSSALRTQRTNTAQEHWGTLITNLRARLEDGSSFSDSLAAYPQIFDPVYINLVRAGEESGRLAETLERLARLYEERDEIRSRVTMAMVYPCVLLGIGMITVIVMMTFVVPMFTTVFRETGQQLPLPTQILLGISGLLSKCWWAILLVAGACGAALSRSRENMRVKTALGRVALSLPLLNRVISTVQLSALARTLGNLLESGVPIVQALRTSAATLSNPVYGTAVADVANSVYGGEVLSKALARYPLFPPAVVSIVAVGEHSGSLPQTLLQFADQLDREIDREVRTVMTLLEPAMIILMGIIVGFIVIAMLLPIFSLGDSLDI